MATAGEEGGRIFITWTIENFSLFLAAGERKRLHSHIFKVELSEAGCAWWRLGADYYDSRIKFGLHDVKGNLPLERCENAAIITSCGEVFPTENDAFFLLKDDVIHLPNDTLTFRCSMREEAIRNQELRICSVLQRVEYLWKVQDYDSSNTYYACIEPDSLMLYGFLSERSETGTHTVTFEQLPCVERCLSFVGYELSIKDGRGRVIKKACIFPNVKLKFYTEILPDENNANICLQLESIVALHKELSPPEIVKQESSSEAAYGSSGALANDLLLLYRESVLSDATIKTEGRSFQAHRSILAARSPVFRAMFERDEMSEGRSGVVDIDDIDSETVDRMLVFLYGDSPLHRMQWEDASALYYAADKYAVHLLKQKCAYLLKAGLTVDKVCDALVLADKHSDQKLMKFVVDFIREHQEVFSLSAWEKLEEGIPRLTTKILREVYVKK